MTFEKLNNILNELEKEHNMTIVEFEQYLKQLLELKVIGLEIKTLEVI